MILVKLLSKEHRIAWFLAGLAFVIRAIYLVELSRDPAFSVPLVDEKWHWEWAHAILSGPIFGEGAWFRAPLYPYFLALLAWITDSSVFWSKLLQSLVSIGTSLFIYRIGLNLYGRTVAIISAAAYALYGTLVFYETSFLIPVLFLFFITWGMARLLEHRDSDSSLDWILTGLLFGLAAISRPNVLLVMPFLALWLWWSRKSDQGAVRAFVLPVMLAVGVCIAVLPVTVRNYVETGDMILISSQGGVNLYLGNNPVADGLTMLMPDVDLNESVSWRQFQSVTEQAAEDAVGHPLSPAEQSSYWNSKAYDFMLSHPGEFLGLIWKKTVYLFSGFENSDNADIYYQRHYSVLYSILVWDGPIDFPFGLLFPLTVAGLILTWEDRQKLLPVYIFILAYVPSIVLFLVTARHRLPLVPFFIVIAAAGVVKSIANIRVSGVRRVIPAIAAGLVTLVLCNMMWYDLGRASDFQIYFNNGLRYEALGDWANAEAEYEKAFAAYPRSAAIANNLGHARLQLGETDQAVKDFLSALRLDSHYGPAYTNLGLVYHHRGAMDSALFLYREALEYLKPGDSIDRAQVHKNMGLAFEKMNQRDSSLSHWLDAVSYRPNDASLLYDASSILGRMGWTEQADRFWQRAESLRPPDATALFNRALSLVQSRRFSEAVGPLQQAVAQNPEMFQAHQLLAAAFMESGGSIDSVKVHLKRCLELAPNYPPANALLQHLQSEGISVY